MIVELWVDLRIVKDFATRWRFSIYERMGCVFLPLSPKQAASVIAIYSCVLLPFVLVSYYDRYAAILFGASCCQSLACVVLSITLRACAFWSCTLAAFIAKRLQPLAGGKRSATTGR